MKTSKNGIKFIGQWEGNSLKAYQDVAGVWTIGYGHTSAAGAPRVYSGMTITQAEAEHILAADLGKVEADVNRLVKVPLTQNQFDTLVSFHYNTGALGRSSALKHLNQGNYNQAAINLTLYNRAGGRVVDGLVNRRTAEKKLFLSKDTNTTGKVVTGGGAIAAGTATAAVASPTNYIPWIIGAGVVAFIGWTLYSTIRDYRKQRDSLSLQKAQNKEHHNVVL